MDGLIQVRSNIIYSKKEKLNKSDKEEFIRFNEIVLLTDKAIYTHTNSGEIVRERGVNELRFTVSQDGLTYLIETLTKYRDIDESELK